MSSSKWKAVKLGDISNYSKDRISDEDLTIENYISTENMLPQKAGKTIASSLPAGNAIKYRKGQTLISNIRPYFKKIWYANVDGGCSSDVLAFRISEDIHPKYFYYLLSQDAFFEHVMAGSKGTKMPRGDKQQIMMYPLLLPGILEQKCIAETLSCIDEKIELNNDENKNLELQAQSLFNLYFAKYIPTANSLDVPLPKNWKLEPLCNLVTSVDNRGKTPPLSANHTAYPIIDVKALSGQQRIVNYSNCTKYVDKETFDNWFRSGHPKPYDILISTVGSLAELKIFLGSKGCIAQNVVGFRTKSVSPLYLFQYLQAIKNDLVSYNIGSVQPSIKVTHINKHPILVPDDDTLEQFHELMLAFTNQIFNSCKENSRLINLRETLLPKLMSGEINVSEVIL